MWSHPSRVSVTVHPRASKPFWGVRVGQHHGAGVGLCRHQEPPGVSKHYPRGTPFADPEPTVGSNTLPQG